FPSSTMGIRTPRRTPAASVYATTLSSVVLSGSSPASRFARKVRCVRLPSVLLRASSTFNAGSLGGNQSTALGASFQSSVTVTVPAPPAARHPAARRQRARARRAIRRQLRRPFREERRVARSAVGTERGVERFLPAQAELLAGQPAGVCAERHRRLVFEVRRRSDGR